MKLIHCEYCGTEYNDDLARCPLCGRAADGMGQAPKSRQTGGKGGARLASKAGKTKEERIPQWMWAVSSVVLGVAVLVGLLYFLISMGYLGGKKNSPQLQPEQQQQQVQEAPDWELDPEVVPEQNEPTPEPEPEPEHVLCESLDLSDSLIIMTEEGETAWLTANRYPEGCTEPIEFSSMDEAVATVNQVGLVAGVASGQTQILVTCGQITEKCTIVCDFEQLKPEPEVDSDAEPDSETEPEPAPEPEPEPEPVEEPKLSSVDFTLFRPGEETTLEVKNAPENAYITFTSSDPDVATVSGTGVVKAVGAGTATITVTVNDKKLTCIARCRLESTTENNEDPDENEFVGSLSLSHVDATLFNVGENFRIRLSDDAGNEPDGLNWSSSDTDVCTVDGNGKIVAVGRGTATVSTIYDGETYKCVVRCNFE